MDIITAQISITNESDFSDEELVNGFLGDCKLRRLSLETIQGYRSSLLITAKILHERSLSIRKLDKDSLVVILEYLLGQGYVHNTLLQYFAALSGFSDYLIWEGLSNTNQVIPFRKRYLIINKIK